MERFDPPLGAPRFLNLLESSSPIFLGVSFDAIGPMRFLLKRGARGAKAISKGYVLIAICCVTKFVSYYIMEDIQKTDLELAMSTHVARYRAPRFILTDNGSSNDVLENHQKSIIEVLQKNAKLEILQSSHQFLNLVESQIKIFKQILRSIYCGIPASAPLNTRAELHMIFSHICNILNSRPLSTQDDSALVLNANQLVKPYLSNTDQEILISKFLNKMFDDNDRHLLLTKIFSNNNEMAVTASQILKREFLNNAKLFSNKPVGLKPQVGDIIAVLKTEPRIGLILQVLSEHRVVVRLKQRGTNVDQTYHIKILALIFRPATPVHFISTLDQPNDGLNHLLSSFWAKLRQQLTYDSEDAHPNI